MPAELAPADGDEFQIQRNAELCHSRFRQILILVNQDEDVACRIPLLFVQAEDADPILTIADLRDEFEQFRVWANNIGVFASDHASLDYRLREAVEVKQGVVSLLSSLESDLVEVWVLLKQDQKYGTHSRGDFDEDGEEGSDSETESLTDFEITRLEIQNHLDHISDLITKLTRLARVIRISGARSRLTKAAKYVHYDEDGVNQTKAFEETYLPAVLRHRYQIAGPLLSRLCKVISSRRRQFLYQQKHQKRLAYSGTVSGEINMSIGTLLIAETGKPAHSSRENVVDTHTSARSDIESQKPAPSGGPAPTLATTFKVNNLDRLASSTIVASTTKLALNNIDFPPPPAPLSDRATHFQCPYCCLLVDERKRESTHWRKHLVHDLQPFVCIEPTCPDPNIILETWNDWVEHHKWTHAMEWWCEGIELDHPPSRYTTSEEYADHLLSCHTSNLSLGTVSRMVTGGGGPSQEPFKNCPFCTYQPRSATPAHASGLFESARFNQSKIQGHIFDHLMSMFMLALPGREDIEGAMSEGDGSSLRRSSAAAGRLSHVSDGSLELIEASELPPRLFCTIRDRQVDVTDLEIDVEYLEALPEELREEVIMQAYADRRERARKAGADPNTIDEEFFIGLPEDIREEIIEQERRATSSRKARPGDRELHEIFPDLLNPLPEDHLSDFQEPASPLQSSKISEMVVGTQNSGPAQPGNGQTIWENAIRTQQLSFGRPGLTMPKTKNTARKQPKFPCTFHHFGCNACFKNKNEWKRHVASQHLQLGFYRCDMDGCSDMSRVSPNDFNRKDLFTQHCRRMHAPWSSLKQGADGVSKRERDELEAELEATRSRCWVRRRESPTSTNCGFCRKKFVDNEGSSGWDERMEHVGRHYERDHAVKEDEAVDDGLKEWAISEGLITEGEKKGEYWLPGLQPATAGHKSRAQRTHRRTMRSFEDEEEEEGYEQDDPHE